MSQHVAPPSSTGPAEGGEREVIIGAAHLLCFSLPASQTSWWTSCSLMCREAEAGQDSKNASAFSEEQEDLHCCW